jgi:hypothetical protein
MNFRSLWVLLPEISSSTMDERERERERERESADIYT